MTDQVIGDDDSEDTGESTRSSGIEEDNLESVSNGSRPSLQVQVRVQPALLPNWRTRLSINRNSQLGYSSMVTSLPV